MLTKHNQWWIVSGYSPPIMDKIPQHILQRSYSFLLFDTSGVFDV